MSKGKIVLLLSIFSLVTLKNLNKNKKQKRIINQNNKFIHIIKYFNIKKTKLNDFIII